MLRGLVAEDVLAEDEDNRFSLTAVGACLPAFRGAALARGELYASAAPGLLDAVVYGGTGFERVYGQSFFDHLDQHPEHDAAFRASMVGRAEREAAAVAAACDFTGVRHVVDVGGGNGVLLAEILRTVPGARGVLVDREAAIAESNAHLAACGLTERAQCVVGDFFDAVPEGGDRYVLSRVLHDWDDDDAHRILTTCRRAMPAAAKLVVVDAVLPDRAEECPAAVRLDLNMLVLLGGRERTEDELRDLFAGAGFALDRIAPTGLPARLSVIETTPH